MLERYSRQIRFAPLGPDGQARLGRGHVLVVGIGALGTHVVATLVRAGIGRLSLIDRDVVELHNLSRQTLFTEADARHGRPKAVAAVDHLRAIDGSCQLTAFGAEFDVDFFEQLSPRPDVIVDATDNFATRYLINDLAHRDRIPWIYGGAIGARGTAMAVQPGLTPCLRCLLPHAPPAGEVGTCETEGIVAPAIEMVAAFQSMQALKLLSGRLDAVTRGVFTIDLWNDRFAVTLRRATPAPDCPVCAAGEYPALTATPPAPAKLCGRAAVQVRPSTSAAIDLARLTTRLRGAVAELELTPHLLRFVAEGCRFSVFPGGRALLFGVDDTTRARVLYDRWIGAS